MVSAHLLRESCVVFLTSLCLCASSLYLRAHLIFLQLLYGMRTKKEHSITHSPSRAKSFYLNMMETNRINDVFLLRTVLRLEMNRNHHKTKRRLHYQTCKIFHNFYVSSESQSLSNVALPLTE